MARANSVRAASASPARSSAMPWLLRRAALSGPERSARSVAVSAESASAPRTARNAATPGAAFPGNADRMSSASDSRPSAASCMASPASAAARSAFESFTRPSRTGAISSTASA